MQHILIDPYSLVLNRQETSNKEVYLDRILDMYKLRNIKFLKPLIFQETSEILWEENGYPEWDKLQKIIKENSLETKYCSQDITIALNSILKYETIEKYSRIKDILCESREDNFSEDKSKIYSYYALNRRINGETILKSNKDDRFNYHGDILAVDTTELEISTPLEINDEILSISSLNSLLLNIDIVSTLLSSKDITLLDQYIKLYFMQNRYGKSPNKLSIGRKFNENFIKYGFLNEENKINSFLKAVYKIIYNINLQDTHQLRITEAGNSPQRVGKYGKAYRVDIDYEYHMHYWKDGKNIVVACVGPHNYFDIPE